MNQPGLSQEEVLEMLNVASSSDDPRTLGETIRELNRHGYVETVFKWREERGRNPEPIDAKSKQ